MRSRICYGLRNHTGSLLTLCDQPTPQIDQEITLSTPKLTKRTGPQFDKWINAFVGAFDMDSLRGMLRTKLGERLDKISQDNNFKAVVQDLIG